VKILVVPMEVPWPANAGGRIDVWRRLRYLREDGHRLALLSWHNLGRDGPLPSATLEQLAAVCDSVQLSWIRRTLAENLRRVALLPRWPSHVAARWITLDRPAVLSWARAFAPDVLLLDGLYGVAAVRWLSASLGVPWVYRAHNVEHVYMRQQQSRAQGWSARLGLAANRLGLRRLEENTVREAAQVFDISHLDAAQWGATGQRHVQWLPTVVDADFVDALEMASARAPAWDIGYFGNLHTPNNVEAVRWLVQQVLPRMSAPGLRVMVAGSAPSAEVRECIAADPRITLLEDPPSMPELIGAARVLVNPLQVGSGVNLKSVEMLFTHARLVSTPGGLQGLTPEAQSCFDVQADAAGFAQALARALHAGPQQDDPQRMAARAPFAPAQAARLLRTRLEALVGQGRS
jgi:hypothetical protein